MSIIEFCAYDMRDCLGKFGATIIVLTPVVVAGVPHAAVDGSGSGTISFHGSWVVNRKSKLYQITGFDGQ